MTVNIDPGLCDRLFCHEDPEYIFTDDMGVETRVCAEDAEKFPADRLEPIEQEENR